MVLLRIEQAYLLLLNDVINIVNRNDSVVTGEKEHEK